jgi:hypothetical protein
LETPNDVEDLLQKTELSSKGSWHNDDEEEDIFLETPNDVEDLLQKTELSSKGSCIRIAQRLFGPPSMSLTCMEQTTNSLSTVGELRTFHDLNILKGTIMGQVFPAKTVAMAAGAPNLQILRIKSGLIFDSATSVYQLAAAVLDHEHLREIYLLQFLNHVRRLDGEFTPSLLDPLMYALSTIAPLETVELSCLASFVAWKKPLLSTHCLSEFLSHRHLLLFNLSNLGLEDEQFGAIVDTCQKSCPKELILNANDNTRYGLRKLMDLLPLGLVRLEAMNDAKMDAETFEILHGHLRLHSNQLQYFQCTNSISTQQRYHTTIDMYLKLHRLDLEQRYYHPRLATPKECIQVLSEVDSNIDCLYTLLREKPSLCNVAMNGCSRLDDEPNRLRSWTRWLRTLLFFVALWTLLFQLLWIQTTISRRPLQVPSDSSPFLPDESDPVPSPQVVIVGAENQCYQSWPIIEINRQD